MSSEPTYPVEDPALKAMGEVVPFVRGEPGSPHSEETRMRCFILFATEAGRNCAAVERLIAEELQGTGAPVPTRGTITAWCSADDWHTQADELWRNTKMWGVNELKVLAMANALLGQRRRNEVLQGAYLNDNDAAAQYLKAGELADKFVERVIPLSMMQMPAKETEDGGRKAASREEREAEAKAGMIQRER